MSRDFSSNELRTHLNGCLRHRDAGLADNFFTPPHFLPSDYIIQGVININCALWIINWPESNIRLAGWTTLSSGQRSAEIRPLRDKAGSPTPENLTLLSHAHSQPFYRVYESATNSLSKALTYCRRNDLAMNSSKTVHINFSKRKDHILNPPDVSGKDHVKLLGVTIDTCQPSLQKIGTGIYVVCRIKYIGTLEAAKTAYYALVESHLRYGLPVRGGSSAGNLNRVLLLQKKPIQTLAEL
ncbi:hypothetical protein J6590_011169 [Homalodisca vitripennis]|nr:hypothetical protein J6590_011169 [Homalodisca vitripennis]